MENKQICLIFFLVSIIFSSFGGAQEVNLSDELELNILSAAIINLSNSISDVEKTLDSNKRLDQEKT
ncbi:hypothetical protein HYS50_01325, partial [Candidatus Woesearchaeota archaeon]|nr:hypothetical protein [Candidatus Woesearchaeota archaeon]